MPKILILCPLGKIMMLFSFFVMFSTSIVAAEDDDSPVKIIKPQKQVELAKAAAIDTERFELGLYVGSLSIEDFKTKPVFGASFIYHINDRFLAQINLASSDAKRATFEDLEENRNFFSDDRDFVYYSLSGGYNLFPARSFLGKNLKFNSRIYLLAGVGNVSFLEDESVSFHIGSSYRIVFTDWLTGNIDFKNHIHERSLLGEEKLKQNLELSFGLNVLF